MPIKLRSPILRANLGCLFLQEDEYSYPHLTSHISPNAIGFQLTSVPEQPRQIHGLTNPYYLNSSVIHGNQLSRRRLFLPCHLLPVLSIAIMCLAPAHHGNNLVSMG